MRTREDNIVTTIDGSTCSCLYKEVDIIEQIIAYYYRDARKSVKNNLTI